MLETEICGVKFKNPIIVASGPPTRNADYLIRSFENGAGGAVVKTVSDNAALRAYIRPRFTILHKRGYPFVFSNYSSEFASPYPINDMVSELRRAKKSAEKLGAVLIGSIMASSINSWAEMAKQMEETGIDMLEVWLGGRIGGTDTTLGSMTYSDYCEEVCRIVSKAIRIPVFAKLSLEGIDVLQVAKTIQTSGIQGVTLADRMSGLEIDLKTGRPILTGGFARVGGPWMRPVILNWLAKIAKEVPLALSASGGFLTYQDVIKAIMCGSSTVQICTGILYGKKGYRIIKDTLKGMTDYFAQNQISSVNELRGRSLNQIKEFRDLTRISKGGVWCEIDSTRCDNCKLCIKRCYFEAIDYINGKVIIDHDKCDGCGLCLVLCPKDAISIIGDWDGSFGDFS